MTLSRACKTSLRSVPILDELQLKVLRAESSLALLWGTTAYWNTSPSDPPEPPPECRKSILYPSAENSTKLGLFLSVASKATGLLSTRYKAEVDVWSVAAAVE